jgi:hypothetical protein
VVVFDNETICFGFSDAYTLIVARNNFDAQTELATTNLARVISELELAKRSFSFLQAHKEVSCQEWCASLGTKRKSE